ncbi:MAG: tail fiber domain-containing protein, partial [Flavobacteriales bacterium]|nr:tail fiber domain-containing protein [Flavobacteriales bacterium]
MKRTVIIAIVISIFGGAARAQVGIGTTTPDASAILDLTSTTKGMLISRVTMVQRNAIVSPAAGLMIYQIDNTPGYYYNSGTPGAPTWLRLINNATTDNDWTLDGDTLYSAPDSAVVIRDKKVGIGTTSPGTALEVFSTAEGIIRTQPSTGANDNAIVFGAASSTVNRAAIVSTGNGVDGDDDGDLRFFTNQSLGDTYQGRTGAQMVIRSSGNVGIGTITPNGRFNVSAGGNAAALVVNATTGRVGVGLTAPGAALEVFSTAEGIIRTQPSAGANDNAIVFGAASSTLNRAAIVTTGGGANGDLNGDLRFFTNQALGDTYEGRTGAQMVIRSSGNVGIGTTTPNDKLQIGDAFSLHDGGHEVLGIGYAPGPDLDLNSAGYASEIRLDPTNGILQFRMSSSLTNSPIVQTLALTKDGDVGIGTGTPSAKLEVSSTTSGVLIPRVTLVQRNAIVTPVTSELVYQTDNTPGYYYWDGTAWVQMLISSGSGSGWATTGNAGLSAATNFVGTTDKVPLVFRTDNTERMRVDTTTGNVGIGTTSPTAKLQIKGDANYNLEDAPLNIQNSTNSAKSVDIGYDNTIDAGFIQAVHSGTAWKNLVLNAAGGNSGNVGIGTTTPAAKLEVLSPALGTLAGNTTEITRERASSGNNNKLRTILRRHTAGADWNGTNMRIQKTVDASNHGFIDFGIDSLATNRGLGFGTDDTTHMVIEPEGDVGIGTTGPSSRLHVVGPTGGINGSIISENSGGKFIEMGSGTAGSVIDFDNAGYLSIRGKANASKGADTGSEFVRITNTGNVGIGTTTPAALLHSYKATGLNDIRVESGDDDAQFRMISGAAVNANWNVGTGSTSTGSLDDFYIHKQSGTIGVKLTIKDNGNIGIGTTSPSDKLHVDGRILSQSTVVGNNGIAFQEAAGNRFWVSATDASTVKFSTGATPGASTDNLLVVKIGGGAGVGIGTGTPSAALDVSSTTSGILIPRVTQVQRNAIVAPVTSELVFQTDNTPAYYYWDGAVWVQMLTVSGPGSGWATTGNAGTNWNTNFLGTTDNISLRFRTNNTEKMIIDSVGNVGIGTEDPVTELHIKGDIRLNSENVNKFAELRHSSPSGSILMIETGNNGQLSSIEIDSEDHITFDVLNAERMRIDKTGNVGIGTASPGAKLHLSGNGYSATDTLFLIQNDKNSTPDSVLMMTKGGNVGIGTTNPLAKLHITGGTDVTLAGGGNIVSGTTTSTNIAIDDNEIMARNNGLIAPLFLNVDGGDVTIHNIAGGISVFKEGGNVGIGTATPTGLLHINHGADIPSLILDNGTKDLAIPDGQQMQFGHWDGVSAYTERMIITAAGNVGIGTPTPGAKLTVQGNTRTYQDGNFAVVEARTSSDGAHSPHFITRRSRGTLAAPTYVLSGETIGVLDFRNHTNSFGSRLIATATENHSAVAAGADLTFSTIPNGSNSSFARIKITHDGNVGIGTTNPFTRLDVHSAGVAAGETAMKLENPSTAAFASTQIDINVGAATRAQIIAQRDNLGSGGYFILNTADGAGVQQERMRINEVGNVGIGTTTPGAKLEVAGQIKITGGTPAAGEVLTSDGAGLATWEPAAGGSGGGWTDDGTVVRLTTSTDNVGIGTTTPSSPLHVFNTAAANAAGQTQVRLTGVMDAGTVGSGPQILFTENTTGNPAASIRGYTFGASATGLAFATGWNALADRMVIDNTGNVGIGTTTPGAKLEVAGQIKITGGTPGASKVLTSDAAGLATWQTPSGGGGDFSNGGEVGIADRTLGNTDNFDLGFLTNNINRLHIQNDGNVGIGTTTPSSPLHVFNTAAANVAGQTQVRLTGVMASATVGSGPQILFTENTTGNPAASIRGYTFGASATGLAFATGWNALADRMVIDNTGNVGIGTTTPGAKLEVAGQIKITGGTPAAGEVLTSDGTGLATWEPAAGGSGGGWTDDGTVVRLTTNTDNVGIGTTGPLEMLHLDNPTSTLPSNLSLGNNFQTLANTLNNGLMVYSDNGTIRYGLKLQYTGTAFGTMMFGPNQAGRFLSFGKVGVAYEDDDMTEYMRIDLDNGNVGIGTATPAEKLHISGGQVKIDGGNELQLENSGATNAVYLWNDGGATDDKLALGRAVGVADMVIDNIGSVGIGTATPVAKLEVSGATVGTLLGNEIEIARLRAASGNNNQLRTILRRHTGGGDWTGTDIRLQKTVDATDHGFIDFGIDGLASNTGLGFGSGATTSMVVRSSGNVGIGTTGPLEMLHLDNPTATLPSNLSLGNNSQTLANTLNNGLNLFSDNGTVRYGLKLQYTGTEFGTMMFGPNQADRFLSFGKVGAFYEDDNMTEYMRIDLDNGNVGIGTPTPAVKLHVSGGKVKIDGGNELQLENSGATNSVYVWNGGGATDDQLALGRSVGVADMVINNIGFVGIGTTSPTHKLEVSDIVAITGSGGNIGYRMASAGAGHRQWIAGACGTGGVFGTGNFGIRDETSALTRLVINSSGNVGIGTTSPLEMLHLDNPTSTLPSNLSLGNNFQTLANTLNNGLMVYSDNGTARYGLKLQYTGTEFGTMMFGPNQASRFLSFGKVGAAYEDDNMIEYMRIDLDNGNVGIGTATPGGQFELSLDQGRKPATNTWTIVSDERLKNIEGPYTKGLSEILELQPITYQYKNHELSEAEGLGERKFTQEVLNTQNVGFSAQEIQKIFPEAVGTDADGYLNFNMHAVLVAYVNAIQELADQNTSLEKSVDTLKAENNALKEEVVEIKSILG